MPLSFTDTPHNHIVRSIASNYIRPTSSWHARTRARIQKKKNNTSTHLRCSHCRPHRRRRNCWTPRRPPRRRTGCRACCRRCPAASDPSRCRWCRTRRPDPVHTRKTQLYRTCINYKHAMGIIYLLQCASLSTTTYVEHPAIGNARPPVSQSRRQPPEASCNRRVCWYSCQSHVAQNASVTMFTRLVLCRIARTFTFRWYIQFVVFSWCERHTHKKMKCSMCALITGACIRFTSLSGPSEILVRYVYVGAQK